MEALVITDVEAARRVLQVRGRYHYYLGAGTSAEAGVPTAREICDEIRSDLLEKELPLPRTAEAVAVWENARLRWGDAGLRYCTCICASYPNRPSRVDYFRSKAQKVGPSFCHHAIALLMTRGDIRSTCLTTNFDKLIESAFLNQGDLECQAIRTDAELEYWQSAPNRPYVLKLHGDYDTGNVFNTADETIAISEAMTVTVKRLLQASGLLVLGTAGYEKSIHTLFDQLARAHDKENVLAFGLLWGVHMGGPKPSEKLTVHQIAGQVHDRIASGTIGPDILSMMKRMAPRNESFAFFPVWGAGNFLFDLTRQLRETDKYLAGRAELFLDHEQRLRHVFSRAGLSDSVVAKHLESLRRRRNAPRSANERSGAWETVLRAASTLLPLDVRFVYGDITSRSRMSEVEFHDRYRAVVSPEDTLLSAGGGVALTLLEKAGRHGILNELAKFSPIPQTQVAVTSGGRLPVHYIFHAASVAVEKDGAYDASQEAVTATMEAVLQRTAALDVGVLLVPLLAAGVASLDGRHSFEAILRAIAGWSATTRPLTVVIVCRREAQLPRGIAEEVLRRQLEPSFACEQVDSGGDN